MSCVSHFFARCASQKTHGLGHVHVFRVRFVHILVLFDLRNVQKLATKSDTSGHCLPCNSNSEAYILMKWVLNSIDDSDRLAGHSKGRASPFHSCTEHQ